MEALLKGIENGVVLDAATFSDLDISAVLDGRDKPPFESEWLRVFGMLDSRKLQADKAALLERLRESAYKAAYRHTSDPDLAGYVSDDFDLIGRALAFDAEDPWLNGLFKCYLDGSLPSSSMETTSLSLNQLINSLAERLRGA